MTTSKKRLAAFGGLNASCTPYSGSQSVQDSLAEHTPCPLPAITAHTTCWFIQARDAIWLAAQPIC